MCMVTKAIKIRPLASRSLARTVCMSQLVISPPAQTMPMIASPATPVWPRRSRPPYCLSHSRYVSVTSEVPWGCLCAGANSSCLLGGAAVAGPVAGWAQPGKVPRIGILVLGNLDPAPFLKEFREGLARTGLRRRAGDRVRISHGEGIATRARSALAAELVALKVDIIVGFQTPAVTAAKQATADIPDRHGQWRSGRHRSCRQSGAAGRQHHRESPAQRAELGGKNLELIREVLPSARRVAVLAERAGSVSQAFPRKHSGRPAGRSASKSSPSCCGAQRKSMLALPRWRNGGPRRSSSSPVFRTSVSPKWRSSIALPRFAPNQNFPVAGGLMSYSADQLAIYREIASFVDKIIKGRKPADLPVQLPTKFLVGRQPQDRQRARPHAAADAAHPRRPGDRITRSN